MFQVVTLIKEKKGIRINLFTVSTQVVVVVVVVVGIDFSLGGTYKDRISYSLCRHRKQNIAL